MRYRRSKPYLYDMADNSMHRITQESQGKTRLYLPLKGRVLPVVGVDHISLCLEQKGGKLGERDFFAKMGNTNVYPV
ncbi:unnamed protein product [Brugia pahangi]|uniref:Uncharacterized protein n=1 Tax=Brugia pahangi TaxID=6280 RepID=A0A0N4SY58_BRUPA|nr:unnamed protein product [Brugia pahangi]